MYWVIKFYGKNKFDWFCYMVLFISTCHFETATCFLCFLVLKITLFNAVQVLKWPLATLFEIIHIIANCLVDIDDNTK